MRLLLKRILKEIFLGFSFLTFILSMGSPSTARGGMPDPRPIHSLSMMSREADMLQILSVLVNRMEDQKLFEKARDKLSILSDRQMRLIASLSDRIANEGKTAGTDIAFFLITALIILS